MAQEFRSISGKEKSNMKGQFNFSLIKHLERLKCLHGMQLEDV